MVGSHQNLETIQILRPLTDTFFWHDVDTTVFFGFLGCETNTKFDLYSAFSQLLSKELRTSSTAHLRIVAILEKYQEQSQLLDPHLEILVMSLLFC